jgi:carbamoyltransferase
VPILLNTSFNRSEPIVASPKDAIACYLASGMDVLVLGDFYTSDRPATSEGHMADWIRPASAREVLDEAVMTARTASH